MIVSTNPKFIFLHIPKTAGTSVEESLNSFHDYDYHDNPHAEMMLYYDDMSEEEYNTFYKFTVIRNPFNLLYSTWSYYVKQNNINIEFNEWIKWRFTEKLTKYSDTIDIYGDGNFRMTYYINKNPQTFWLINNDGDFILDHVICFENIEKDLQEVFDILGLGEMYLPHTNKNENTGKNYMQFYNEESIEIVKKEFKIDLDLFGYNEYQDKPTGGLWGKQIKGKNLRDFGYGVPDGIKLNVGNLPYGPHDLIYRYYNKDYKEDLVKEFNEHNLLKRRDSLSHDIDMLLGKIDYLENKLTDPNIDNEETTNIMSTILNVRERILVYKRKIVEINNTLS